MSACLFGNTTNILSRTNKIRNTLVRPVKMRNWPYTQAWCLAKQHLAHEYLVCRTKMLTKIQNNKTVAREFQVCLNRSLHPSLLNEISGMVLEKRWCAHHYLDSLSPRYK